jgi:hypothetical protein
LPAPFLEPAGSPAALELQLNLGIHNLGIAKARPASSAVPAMPKPRQWVRDVKTVSTFPPEGLFTKDAETIARVMATEEVSPKGIGSGIRMVQFFINRAGKSLPPERRRELEKAKEILQAEARKQEKGSRKG